MTETPVTVTNINLNRARRETLKKRRFQVFGFLDREATILDTAIGHDQNPRIRSPRQSLTLVCAMFDR
jgi:hypothetical protein